jgi:CRISPR/Cas system-associated exonuclease Cas4 (RecB family)
MTKNLIKNLTSKPKNTKIDPKKLVRQISKAYVYDKNKVEKRQKFTFSPSTVGYSHGTCARYWNLVFSGAEFEETFTAQGIAAMQNGTDSHNRLQKLMVDNNLVKEIEREIRLADPPIRGFADLIFEVDGQEVVGEIKTIKDEYFTVRKNNSTPSDSHLVQLLIYMKALDLEEGVFIYENKNTHDLAGISVVMSDENKEYIDYIFNWMREVYAAWKDGKNIKRPFTKSSNFCKYCPIMEDCWSRPDGRTKIESLKVKKL